MGSIGGAEILIVLLVALIVLGPTRLPQAARQLGKALGEFRRMTSGLQAELRDTLNAAEPSPPPAPGTWTTIDGDASAGTGTTEPRDDQHDQAREQT